MSELDPDVSNETPEPRARRPRWQRVLIGIGIGIGALVLLVVALFFYGGPSGSVNDPAMKQQYEQLVAAGQVAPVERKFVLPIPGCQCHSTDPYLTEQHRYRHMNQCGSCHGG